jgi:hypothetical protein
VEALADVLHGSEKSLIRVDCGEFQMEHEVAKLIGAPPGYLGHRETQPILSQQKLAAITSENCGLSLVLFDEIEKASSSNNVVLSALWAHSLSSFSGSVGFGSTSQPGVDAASAAQGISLSAKTGNSLSAGARWSQVWDKTAWDHYVAYDFFNSGNESAALGLAPKFTTSSARSTVTVGGGYKINDAQKVSGSLAMASVNTKSDPGVEASLSEMLGSLRYDLSF